MVLVCLGCVLYLCVISWYLNNMQIVVGVFGVKMVVSFWSSGVGSNAGNFGQFRTAHVLFGDC